MVTELIEQQIPDRLCAHLPPDQVEALQLDIAPDPALLTRPF